METTHILLADDDTNTRQMFFRILGHHKMKLISSSDGHEAILRIKESRPDLVFAAIDIPIYDGFSLLKWIRSNKQTTSIPVVLLLQQQAEEPFHAAAFYGAKLGADGFLMKPIISTDILDLIRYLLPSCISAQHRNPT